MWKIIIGILLIIGGCSGEYVLIGTNSNVALVIVGIILLGWGLYQVYGRQSVSYPTTQQVSFPQNSQRSLPERAAVEIVSRPDWNLEELISTRLSSASPDRQQTITKILKANPLIWMSTSDTAALVGKSPDSIEIARRALPPELVAQLPLPQEKHQALEEQQRRAAGIWFELAISSSPEAQRIEHWQLSALNLRLLLALDLIAKGNSTNYPTSKGSSGNTDA